MQIFTKIYFSLSILSVSFTSGYAQTILNEYARIDSFINIDSTDVDSLIVSDGSIFAPLDTVLYIEMRGIDPFTPERTANTLYWGTSWQINNTGKYSIQLVDRVIGDTIILATSLPDNLFPQVEGEMAQLVKIPGADIFELSGEYTCKAWDADEGTGGVFALVAGRKIIMNNAVIDVTGKGFKGGDPWLDEFNGECGQDSLPFYTDDKDDRSGRRGESPVLKGFKYTRGRWFALNGGGGGNGSFSGGGGGSNYGWGGIGGKEADYCITTDNWSGKAGKSFEEVVFRDDRLFMGGGGGTGTQQSDRPSSKGGSGGGIIILISDTLISMDSDTIRANGQTVTDIAAAGGGGGGGGGIIAVDVENFIGNIHMEVKGGDGGKTNDPDTVTGPGGGGGAGLVWHKFSALPSNVTINLANGEPGIHIPTNQTWGATLPSSNDGGNMNNLNILLRGFLFNIMPYDQDVCQYILPDTIWASYPKGGDGTFSYHWQQSPDQLIWTDAGPARNDTVYFAPGLLMDTTFYRRIVTSGTTSDTSLIHTIHVLPALTNNSVAADDTICQGASPIPLYHNAGPIGGGNLADYFYSWELSYDNKVWIPADGTNDELGHAPEGLLDTTWYRRIVTSHVCTDTSNVLTITVLDSIRGNTLYKDTSICQFTAPNTIISDLITGGEPGEYRYKWQKSSNKMSWTDIPVVTEYYYPGTLDDTVYYKRIIYSGSEDACIDTSNIISIIVHPVIQGNNILVSVSNTICEGETANTIIQGSGSVTGGNTIYSYTWQSMPWTGTTWADASGDITPAFYEPGIMTDSTFFRRLILSGACKDTSNQVIINVHPMVVNNIIGAGQTICDLDLPEQLVDVPPEIGGGIGTYSYLWIYSSPDSISWLSTGSTGLDYSPPRLSDTTWYKRIVLSGACNDSSNIVAIFVQDSIRNNTLLNGPADSTCYLIPALIEGTTGPGQISGGDETIFDYQWIKSSDNTSWNFAPLTSNLSDYTTGELADSTYYRRVVSSGACVDTSESTLIRINPRPTGHIVDSAYQNACYLKDGSLIDYEVLIYLTGRPPYSFEFDDGISGTTVHNFDYPTRKTFQVLRLTDDSAHYVITLTSITDSNDCEALPGGMTGTATASIYKIPETIITTDTQVICDSVVTLTADKDVGMGTWSVIEGDDNMVFINPNGSTTVAETVFGDKDSLFYKILWTEQNWECISRDSVEIVFLKQPDPAFAGNDSTVYFADTLRLFAAPATAGVGVWTLEAGDALIDDSYDPASFINLGSDDLDDPRDYTFRWTITNGICNTVDDDVILSRRDIRRYGGFSPDGNEINDYYVIRGLDYADYWVITFYSRHGNQLRKISSDQNVPEDQLWDGKLENGMDLEDGTYYYILIVTKGNRNYEYKGTVELARERL